MRSENININCVICVKKKDSVGETFPIVFNSTFTLYERLKFRTIERI